MTISLLKNIAAIQVNQGQRANSIEIGNLLERLSSGQRIIGAADDPAGLAQSALLKSDLKVFKQGMQNVSSGISLINIADQALSELSNILTRQQELAAQAANSTTTDTQRAALDTEAQALSTEFSRIIETTAYNGINLLDGSRGTLTLQAGHSSITLSLPEALDLSGDITEYLNNGTFAARVNYTATGNSNNYGEGATGDFDNDGDLDIVMPDQTNGTIRVMLNNGDGTFAASNSYATNGGASHLADVPWSADFNGDGRDDIVFGDQASQKVWVFLANSNGTFGASVSYNAQPSTDMFADDLNSDGYADIIVPAYNGRISILFANSNGTFNAEVTYATSGFTGFVRTADINRDGYKDLVAVTNSDNRLNILLGNANGTFAAARSFVSTNSTSFALADFNNDGFWDVVANNDSNNNVSILLGNGDGNFGAQSILATGSNPYYSDTGDINGDGNQDFITADRGSNNLSIFLGNGDGNFQARTSYGTSSRPNSIILEDFNGDSILDMFIAQNGAGTAGILLGNGAYVVTPSDTTIDLTTQVAAESSVTILANISDDLNNSIGRIAAAQSRLSATISHVTGQYDNTQTALARVTDIDVAQDLAELISRQVLQDAGTAIMAQANQTLDVVNTLFE